MRKGLALFFFLLLLAQCSPAQAALPSMSGDDLKWIPTGDALWDAFAQATFDNVAAHGLDPETLVVDFDLGESPTELDEAALKALEPRYKDDARYWELCVWSLESKLWQDSLQAETEAQLRLGLKDAAQLPKETRHPWPYYAKIGPYIERLRSLANAGKASPGAVYAVFEHDCARLFWEQNQDAGTLQKSNAKSPEAGFLEPIIDRAHTATFASELSPERQQRFIELVHWVDAHNGGNSFLKLWCAAGLMELGRLNEARPLLLDLGAGPIRRPYLYPLSHVLEQIAPGGELSIDKLEEMGEKPDKLSGRVGLEALLAGMTLARTQLFPPFPFGTKVVNGSNYRDILAKGDDPALLNALHAAYSRAIGETVLDPYGFTAEGYLESIDELAARRMMHKAGELSEEQRWALSAMQSKVGVVRGKLGREMQEADDIDLPGLDTTGMDWDKQFDLATSSIYGYLRTYLVAAHTAQSLASLKDDAQDLQRFDYASSHWRLKTETVRRLGRGNNMSLKNGADDVLRFDYAARTWRASKRKLRRISRRTQFSILDRAASMRPGTQEDGLTP